MAKLFFSGAFSCSEGTRILPSKESRHMKSGNSYLEINESYLSRLKSKFSYTAKFIFISLLYLTALIVVAYNMVTAQNSDINFANKELQGDVYQRNLRHVLKDVPQLQLLTLRYLSGNQALKGELVNLQAQTDKDFQNLAITDNDLKVELQTSNEAFQKKSQKSVNPDALIKQWEVIKQQLNAGTLTVDNSTVLFSQLIADIRALIVHIGDTSQLILDPDIDTYYIMDSTLIRIPEVQDLIPQTMILAQNIIARKAITRDEAAELLIKSGVIQANIAGSQENITKAIIEDKNSKVDLVTQQDLEAPLASYIDSVNAFLAYIDTHLVHTEALPASADEVIGLGNHVLDNSFILFDKAINELDRLLKIRRDNLQHQQTTSVAIAIGLSLIAFLVGLLVMRSIKVPLTHLIDASNSLARGDLKARVKIFSSDEMGQMGLSFNKMAESLDNMVQRIKSAGTQMQDLQKAGIQLNIASNEMSMASKEQEHTINELTAQESTTSEIAATAKEIYATAKDLANTMNQVSKTAEEASSMATSGKEGLDKMSAIMQQMVNASANIAAKLSILNEKANNITGVITTITKVADQTNLLSLNAAIEAEKAGEHGRSFSVIAREIRRLADQTAYATLDIAKMINEMGSAVASAVMGVDKFSEEIRSGVNQVHDVSDQLGHIITQVQQETEGIENVNEGVQAQAQAAEQISEAISHLSDVTFQTGTAIRKFNKTIENLQRSTKEVQHLMEKISV